MTPRGSNEGISNSGLYELLQQIRTEMLGAHDRHSELLRDLNDRLMEHDEKDQLVENRVLAIEIERRNEREQHALRTKKVAVDNSRIAAIIATAVAIIAQIARSTWDFYHHSPGS